MRINLCKKKTKEYKIQILFALKSSNRILNFDFENLWRETELTDQ